MTRRLPVEPAPGPLEEYATRFDDLLGTRAQRDGFRRYLEERRSRVSDSTGTKERMAANMNGGITCRSVP